MPCNRVIISQSAAITNTVFVHALSGGGALVLEVTRETTFKYQLCNQNILVKYAV